MAVADLADYKRKVVAGRQPFRFGKPLNNNPQIATVRPVQCWSLWAFGGPTPAGALPASGSAVCTKATPGAIPITDALNDNYLAHIEAELSNTVTYPGQEPASCMVLCDRLVHSGTYAAATSGVISSPGLPTTPLTRYTDGKGVWLGFEVASNFGAGASSVYGSYTGPSAGGNIGPVLPFGIADAERFSGTTGSMNIMPLSTSGGAGVKSIEITVFSTSCASGTYGIVLFKPLVFVPIVAGQPIQWDALLSGGSLNKIHDDACLFWVQMGGGITSQPRMTGLLTLLDT